MLLQMKTLTIICPMELGMYGKEGRAFGGHDDFYADSRALTDEVRIDLTSQITDKWKARWGLDYKYHRLNFYEIIRPWLGQAAYRQTFAEYWQDTGPDELQTIDSGYVNPDVGENNGRWDKGENILIQTKTDVGMITESLKNFQLICKIHLRFQYGCN